MLRPLDYSLLAGSLTRFRQYMDLPEFCKMVARVWYLSDEDMEKQAQRMFGEKEVSKKEN